MLSNSPQSKTGSAAVLWEKVPAKGWITVLAGISINLCLGVLYAWTVFKAALLANKDHAVGSLPRGGVKCRLGPTSMDPDHMGVLHFCGFVFCAFMIPRRANSKRSWARSTST